MSMTNGFRQFQTDLLRFSTFFPRYLNRREQKKKQPSRYSN